MLHNSCIISIRSSLTISSAPDKISSQKRKKHRFCNFSYVHLRKCLHVLSEDRTSSSEGPSRQRRWTSLTFSANSNSAKSCNLALPTDTRRISIWWQFLKTYEKKSNKNYHHSKSEWYYLSQAPCFSSRDVQFFECLETKNFFVQVIRFRRNRQM